MVTDCTLPYSGSGFDAGINNLGIDCGKYAGEIRLRRLYIGDGILLAPQQRKVKKRLPVGTDSQQTQVEYCGKSCTAVSPQCTTKDVDISGPWGAATDHLSVAN